MGRGWGEENSLGCKYFLKSREILQQWKLQTFFFYITLHLRGYELFPNWWHKWSQPDFFVCLFLAEAFHQTFIFVFVVHLFYTVLHRWMVILYKSLEGTYLQILNEEDLLKKWSLLYNLKDKKLFSVSNFSQQWQNTSISHTQNYRTGRIWFSLCECKSGTIPGQQCCSGLSVV